MADKLNGRRVAILAADGVEQVELVTPRKALNEEGATIDLVSLKSGRIQAMNGDIEPADTFDVDRVVSEVGVDDYDALVVPGGTVNPDNLRSDENAVGFVRDFVAAGKPVAAICHGPWILVEADVVRGRTVTSYPSLRTDIRNAGGTVVEEEVVTDQGITTSRNPDDLPAFCERIVREFAAK
ncbi:type 1 glutamine amidotransferase domain-containing protein [Nocardiopsis sp. HUAS JQ3]|uniref:type 1 glutamine amidotransferase domain-containing protein n=1 Tax=Nocardiopsis sp. HUAS JQ3 TaxID=3061629 RepID=UPI0023A9B505|nr:type 1 glutamine amidotransferase domain-containing protein [Nocardiopsis sp. HUAS JQ3]WDZ93682.1 type 1 glutamine amidotransferase [Nocardiopsis sp. HUAS JQ3]